MKLEDIKKTCIKCGAKCCFLGGPIVTKKERNKILKTGFKNVFVKFEKYYSVKSKNGKCPFLRDRLCLINDVKPLMCRIWPVYPVLKGNKRKFMVLDCPLTKQLSQKELQKLKIKAKKLPKELSADKITDLSPLIKKRLNKFGWNKKIKEILE
jgi:Fe-S-cluster containining protein